MITLENPHQKFDNLFLNKIGPDLLELEELRALVSSTVLQKNISNISYSIGVLAVLTYPIIALKADLVFSSFLLVLGTTVGAALIGLGYWTNTLVKNNTIT